MQSFSNKSVKRLKMSDEEIVIIDSDDESSRAAQKSGSVSTKSTTNGIQEVVLLDDSDSDDVLFEGEIPKGDIQFVGRSYRHVYRSRRKQRNRNRGNSSQSGDRSDGGSLEFLITSDSNQSQPNSGNLTNGLKNESITPPKISPNETQPKHQSFKTSPLFHSSYKCSEQPSTQPLSQPLSQSSDISSEPSFQSSYVASLSGNNCGETPSQAPNQNESENSINYSVVSPTVPTHERSDILDETPMASNVNSMDITNEAIETPNNTIETNDFGVEDNQNEGMAHNMSFTESEFMGSPPLLERSSTPIDTFDSVPKETQKDETETNSLKTKESLNDSIGYKSDTTLNENYLLNGDSIESIPESPDIYKNENNSTKEEASAPTQDFVRKLTFDDIAYEEPQPVGEYYVCSYGECGREFNNALLHYKHEKKHSKELIRKKIATFKCRYDNCPFAGLTLGDLIYHNSEHRGLFLCHKSECFFSARTADDITNHMKSHRSGKKRPKKRGTYCDCGQLCCQLP